jgi:hypothetical protein
MLGNTKHYYILLTVLLKFKPPYPFWSYTIVCNSYLVAEHFDLAVSSVEDGTISRVFVGIYLKVQRQTLRKKKWQKFRYT